MLLTVTIRRAEHADVLRLVDIAYRAWEGSIMPLLPKKPGMQEAEQRRLILTVHQTLERIIVAELDGVVNGWCSRARGRAYIPYLFVSPEAQSHGVGAMLLARAESLFELEGADSVTLETPADNVRAVRFYQKQGYSILVTQPDQRSGQNPFMSVRLEKALHPFHGEVTDGE